MQYRKFGKTGWKISETGFGAWAIGGGAMIGKTAIGWGPADDAMSKKAIHHSLDRGINFFDTADIYGLGHSEELLGKVLRKRHDVYIASKGGNVSRNDEFTFDYSAKHIISACEKSLRRLRREAIDYYQLHSARLVHLQQGECIEAIQTLQQQGKIRSWGASLNTFDPAPEAEYLMNNNLGDGFQLVLNILNQKALSLIRKAAEKNYGIIARMPLQFGLLTGKFDQDQPFSENDHRQKRITPEVVKQSKKALEPVWALCDKYGISKTGLALSYVLNYEVSTMIPGIRSVEHAEDNTAEPIRLDKKDMELIEEFGRNEFIQVMELIRKQG